MSKIVVITGAGAGIGRATATEFARNGYDIALLSRDPDRLEHAAAELRRFGVRALPIPTDVADAKAVEAAADRVEQELGPIDVWVNVAMAPVFAPVSALTPEEVERGTAVTYLGQVHGMMSALKRMRPRNRGAIVNVGSALAYRSVPLQSIYCGAKFAIRGFTDSLRSELIHDGCKVTLTIVDLPAVNTPQFDWARNKMGKKAQPVPPIYQPEVPARAIFFGATHPRRQIWVGFPTVKAVLANRIAPGLIDRYLAKSGYTGQLADAPAPADAPDNLFHPVRAPMARTGASIAAIRAPEAGRFHQPSPHCLLGSGVRRRRRGGASDRQAAGRLRPRGQRSMADRPRGDRGSLDRQSHARDRSAAKQRTRAPRSPGPARCPLQDSPNRSGNN